MALDDSIADGGLKIKGRGRANGALERANFAAKWPFSAPISERGGRARGVRGVRSLASRRAQSARSQWDNSTKTAGQCPIDWFCPILVRFRAFLYSVKKFIEKLYVFDNQGRKICEAVSAELLAFGPHCSQAALEKHLRDQKRQEREVREFLEERTRPYELRISEGGRASEAVGMIDLTIKADRGPRVIALPNDKEFRAELAASSKKKKAGAGDEFLASKADSALSRLRAINE